MHDESPLAELRELHRSGDQKALADYLTGAPGLEFTDDPKLHALLSVINIQLKNQAKAGQHFGQVDEQALDDPDSLADYALACFYSGNPAKALELLTRAAKMPEAGAFVHQRLAGISLLENNLDQAEQAYVRSLDLRPDWPEVLSNIGGIMWRKGDLEAALEYYDRALALNQDLTIPQQQRAKIYVALQRLDELVEEKEERLKEDLDDPRRHVELVSVQIQGERFAEAQANLEAALDRFPDERQVRMLYVNFCFMQKMWGKIGEKLKEWSEADPDDTEMRLLLNEARIEAGFLDTARTDLEAMEGDAAGMPSYYLLQAKILVHEARAEEALELLRDAADRFPGAAEIKFQLSEVLTSLGQLDEAEELVQEAGRLNPSTVIKRVESKGHVIDDAELASLKELADNQLLSGPNRASANFSLAKVYDKRKDFDQSFETLIQANTLQRSGLNYNWRVHRQQTQRSLRAFTPDLVHKLQGLGHDSNRPIFVTGMPRSGTTLTEQILCSHPDVYGAGELQWVPRLTRLVPKVIPGQIYPEAMHAFQREHLLSAASYYLEKIALQNSDAARVVDKMPHNFDNIGLIALMFPNVPIIHMKREPRDVAVSNYFQNFAACHGLMGFAYDLEDIGHMLNDHQRIMDHWHELFPGRIFELDYQELVREPEPTIRKLLDFCGLDWNDQVLKFYETKRPVRTASIRQVREGIYTSSAEKWRRFEKYLEPLEKVLAEGFKPLEETVPVAAAFAAGPTR